MSINPTIEEMLDYYRQSAERLRAENERLRKEITALENTIEDMTTAR